MTCSCSLTRTQNATIIQSFHFVYFLATNVTPSKHHVFHFLIVIAIVCVLHTTTTGFEVVDGGALCAQQSTFIPFTACHMKFAFCFLFLLQFLLCVLPVCFSIVFYLLCSVGGLHISVWCGLRLANHFSETAITSTHTHKTALDAPTAKHFSENYYCFCLCRKIRPKMETIAFHQCFLSFVLLLLARVKRGRLQWNEKPKTKQKKKKQKQKRTQIKIEKKGKYSTC